MLSENIRIAFPPFHFFLHTVATPTPCGMYLSLKYNICLLRKVPETVLPSFFFQSSFVPIRCRIFFSELRNPFVAISFFQTLENIELLQEYILISFCLFGNLSFAMFSYFSVFILHRLAIVDCRSKLFFSLFQRLAVNPSFSQFLEFF